jgi:hypothetical protein
MKTKLTFLIPILISLFCLSCSYKSSNPVTAEGSSVSTLKKTQSNYSRVLPLTYSNGSYVFSYDNYSFRFTVVKTTFYGTQALVATLSVNGYSIPSNSAIWAWSDNYSWIGNQQFTYNGVKMVLNIKVPPYTTRLTNYPDSACATIYDYVKPDPITNLSASPSVHKNLTQAVTLSWTASTDGDVTGYKIYRELNNETSYSLVQTITSRTTSQWIDTSVPWSSANVAQYYITAIDGTHNLESQVSNYVISHMIVYKKK